MYFFQISEQNTKDREKMNQIFGLETNSLSATVRPFDLVA
jgi:hypothetical protein